MKAREIRITPRAKKDIDSLASNIALRVRDAIAITLTNNPLAGKSLKGDLKGLYSYRLGDYRIIYSFTKNELVIWILKVMHRRDIYR